jgi:hypothetical protein
LDLAVKTKIRIAAKFEHAPSTRNMRDAGNARVLKNVNYCNL